jgi:tetratricopeptide (TPR) repeat protein
MDVRDKERYEWMADQDRRRYARELDNYRKALLAKKMEKQAEVQDEDEDEDAELRVARSLRDIGDDFSSRGEWDKACDPYARALAVFNKVGGRWLGLARRPRRPDRPP